MGSTTGVSQSYAEQQTNDMKSLFGGDKQNYGSGVFGERILLELQQFVCLFVRATDDENDIHSIRGARAHACTHTHARKHGQVYPQQV